MPILNDMKLHKTMLYLSGLALAVGGPISFFSVSDIAAGMKKSWFSHSTAGSPQQSGSAEAMAMSGGGSSGSSAPTLLIGSNSLQADTMPLPSLAEVLRFDATVDWVLQRWPRVTTGLPYLQLQGYRVPLVTGTGLADVAGSLTYYFNARQQVQRITFRGTTGDPQRFGSLVGQPLPFYPTSDERSGRGAF